MSEQKNTKAGGTLTDKIKAFVSGEVFSYLFFGVCTTVVNIVVFQLCCTVLGMHAPGLFNYSSIYFMVFFW